MFTIPHAFAQATIDREGEAGRRWIAALPTLFDSLCQEWNLTPDGPTMHGYLGVVTPVRRSREPCVLKLAWRDADTAGEAKALATWAGRGAARLLAADEIRGALLLERLNPTMTLDHVPIATAVDAIGTLLRRLSVPAPDDICLLPDVTAAIATRIPAWWEMTGRRMPQSLVDRACETMRELGRTEQRLLVNYDLHYQNVLRGRREPWLVVDPKALAGDPAYGAAQLFWCRLEDMEAAGGLMRYFDRLIDIAQLDPQRTRAWTIARCVDYWLWGLTVGLTEDPVRCQRIIARLTVR